MSETSSLLPPTESVEGKGNTEDAKEGEADDNFKRAVAEQLSRTRQHFDMVQANTDIAYQVLKEDFEFVDVKRKNIQEMTKKLKDVHFGEIVKLNVGGDRFETSVETIKRSPNSLFEKMFSGSVLIKQGSDGTYFIDRDGSHFRSILNYLRTNKVSLRMKENADELIEEANFYGLKNLAKALSLSKEENEDSVDIADSSQVERMALDDHAKECNKALEKAREQLEQGQKALKEDLYFLEEKKDNFLKMARRLKDVHFSDVIKLNVGGHLFETSVTNLQREPDSMLAAMFSGRFEPLKQKDGAYFIDRDGTNFRHVLNYLRMGGLPRRIIEECGDELLGEAEFYNLKSLIDCILKNTTIKINAGGQIFNASAKVLKKDPTTLFAKMLGNDGGDVQKIDGAYFFDYGSKQMNKLLIFLKEGIVGGKHDLQSMQALVSDASFFQVNSLIDHLKEDDDSLFPFWESSIIEDKPEWRIQLKIWLKEKQRESVPQLIYSAETDGWTAEKFHELCDKKGPTLLLMKSEHGCVFGGFTNISWGPSLACADGKCFVFSLLSKEFKAPVIMSTDGIGGIKTIASSGPSFFRPIQYSHIGQLISNESTVFNVVSEPNVNSCSFVSTYGFQRPQELPNTKTFLAGAESFLLTNFEVYAV